MYIYNRHDRTFFAFDQGVINTGGTINEIRQYMDIRYVSFLEAIYEFWFHMFDISPSVLSFSFAKHEYRHI